jgi:hypothetical protein
MDEWIPEPQEHGWLEPPRRRPPTAVGLATPPPPRDPRHSRYRETRIARVRRVLAQLVFATGLGVAAGEFVPIPILMSLFVGLTGGRLMLKRRRTKLSQLALHFGSSSSRRAA